MPCHAHAALCRGLDKSLSERHGRGKAQVRLGPGMARVNQARPHCVNKIGNTRSKPLSAGHGRGMAWALHGMCELAFTIKHPVQEIQPFNFMYLPSNHALQLTEFIQF
jgi:hypothetical protein